MFRYANAIFREYIHTYIPTLQQSDYNVINVVSAFKINLNFASPCIITQFK
jgi:hypothetical protein